MIPIALRITNFRSYKGTQVFTFPRSPGLYFMMGVNASEPRLEANGSGKSSIWDALSWLSFAQTPGRLKAGDVCNWDVEKGTCVEFDYGLAGDSDCVWTVKRTWGPNSWTLSHVAEYITDEEVIDLTKASSNAYLADLRLEFTPFLNSILTAQRQPMFLDLDGPAQASLFSDVLGLDRWLEYSTKASKKASAQDRVSRDLETEQARVRGQLVVIGRQDFKQDVQTWEKQRGKRIEDLEDEHAALVRKSKGLKQAVNTAQEREGTARKGVARVQPDERAEGTLKLAREGVAALRSDLRLETHRVEEYAAHLHVLLNDKECPTCGERMSRGRHEAEIKKARDQAQTFIANVDRIKRQLAAAEIAHETAQGKADKQHQTLVSAREELDDAQRASSNARRAFDLNERELDRLEERGQEIAAEVNPYRDLEEKSRRNARQLRDELDDIDARLDASNYKQSLYSFWVRGFKELRLVQIAEALTELEVEVNSCVAALGLLDWELNFQVDRETKSGNVQRGFNVFVKSPGNTRAVPWGAWSGGEAQRLRVAATMGLANLIRSRTGATLPLEVWDEPSTGLSPQGVRDLLDALAQRARVEQRVIWVVDHKAHDFGGFAGGCTVTKTGQGSEILQY